MIPVHLAGPHGGRCCGAELGEASWFTHQITCPKCLVLLDEHLIIGEVGVIVAGWTYVKWRKQPAVPV